MLALTQMAPSASSVYGIDVGTSGVKALAIDERGRVLARAEARLQLVDAASGVGRAGS